MDILERFGIFVVGRWAGYVVSSVNLWYCELSILASVELHSLPFGQFTQWPCDLCDLRWQWTIVGLDLGGRCRHLPLWRLPFTFGEGDLGAWSPATAYLIHFTDSILVYGTWVLEFRTRIFHSLHIWIFLINQLRTFGSFTFATAHSTSITPQNISQDSCLFWKKFRTYHSFGTYWLCTGPQLSHLL